MSAFFNELLEGMQEVVEDTKEPALKRHVVSYIPVEEHSPMEIKDIRAKVGFTQTALANYLGVSTKTVEAWESGLRSPGGSANRLLSLISTDNFINKYPFVKLSV